MDAPDTTATGTTAATGRAQHANDPDKGLGRPGTAPTQWNVLRGDVELPCAVLYQGAMEHNLRWMQRFMDEYGLKLAPHGKTTMAPALFRLQVDHGAWGITVATSQQARVAALHGVPRVLMANQLVGTRNIDAVLEMIERTGVRFHCLVDSVAGVDALAARIAVRQRSGGSVGSAGPAGSLGVLVELSPGADQPGVRTGVGDDAGLRDVVAAIGRHAPSLHLAGIELYEGVLSDEAVIRAFLQRAVRTFTALAADGAFTALPDGRAPILSGAGSAWYDVVAEEFARCDIGRPVDVILRPGCYLTHDVGAYRAAQQRIRTNNPVARQMKEGLRPALKVWACVQSLPRADRAIIAMGKRDVAFDAGFPSPTWHVRAADHSGNKTDNTTGNTMGSAAGGMTPTGAPPADAPAHWAVDAMMDQHAFMSIRPDDAIGVGDLIAFDIAHPCLTFDKWRQLLVVDDEHQGIEIIETFF